MTERVQVGARVDAELWREFREQVEQRHGQTRGSLGDELENAIRNYIHFGADKSVPDQLAEMNGRLQRLEAAAGTAEADGGADTFGPETHAHAPTRYDPETDGKPPANSSTDKKVEYLASEIGSNVETVPRAKLRETVKEEYAFQKETAKRYVELLIDHFDLVDHPRNDAPVLVSPERRREILEAEADAELDEVTDR